MAKPKKKRKPSKTASRKVGESDDASGVEEPTEAESAATEDDTSGEDESTPEEEPKPEPAKKARKSVREREPVPENIPTRPEGQGKGAGGLIFVGIIFGLLLFAVVVQMVVGP
ncbi:MAG: hypothetical protein GW913_01240 [Myxococcales bacterium]|nr:hypothetical protein [Myxococcales bacterium]